MEYTVFDILVGAGILLILALLALIVKAWLTKPEEGEILASETVVDGETPVKSEETEKKPVKETDPQRLERTEKELSERENKIKSEKITELEEREKVIKRREEEEDEAEQDLPDKDQLQEDKARIEDLIKKAQQRYQNGELEEKSFKMIVSNYQKQLLDIDIKLKK